MRNSFLIKLVLPIALLFLWEGIYRLKIVDPSLLPSAIDTIKKILELLFTAHFSIDLFISLYRMLLGLVSASIVGVLLGLFMGSYRILYNLVIPIIDFFRSIPVTALYPLFVLTIGVNDNSKIAMIFTSCVFIISINTAYGVSQAKKTRQFITKLYGGSVNQTFFYVKLYESLPQTIVGLRISLSLSLIVVVLTEMFMGAEFGLGQRLTESYTTYHIDEMYAIIIITGLLGYIFNLFFVKIERRVIPWVGK